jgi:hypothetical protein
MQEVGVLAVGGETDYLNLNMLHALNLFICCV